MGPLQVSPLLTEFGGHRQCGIEDMVALICHVISKGHVIKEPFDQGPSCQVLWLSAFLVVEI